MKKLKDYLYIVVLVGILIFGYSKYRDYMESKKFEDLIGQIEEGKKLSENLAILETQYKNQKELNKKLQNEYKEFKLKANEQIKVLSDATFLIGKHVTKQDGPDYYYQTPKGTQNYVLNELRIEGEDSPAIGYIMIKSDGKVYKRNYKFEIEVGHAQTVDNKTGKVKVLTKAYLVKKEVSPLNKRVDGYQSWNNKKYPLKIKGGAAIVDPTQNTSSKYLMWTPRLNAGGLFGVSESGGFSNLSLGVSFAGYGSNIYNLDWKFLELGVGLSDKIDRVYFTPASYRLFKPLKNTYFGPSIGYGKDGISYQLGVSLGF